MTKQESSGSRSWQDWQEAMKAPGLALALLLVYSFIPVYGGSDTLGLNASFLAIVCALTAWYAMQFRRAVGRFLPLWVICLTALLIICMLSWEMTYQSAKISGLYAGGRLGI